jgi:Rps23 Pro-64 3,4-dihydroxylase Tpa1-like proline 4-hydroxylase
MEVVPGKNMNFLVMKNALSEMDLKIVLDEIKDHESSFKSESIADAATFNRWYPDNRNPISKVVDRMLYGERIKQEVKNFPDLSWSLLRNEIIANYEVQVTKYKPNSTNQYRWHTDHLRKGRIMNYILYLSTPDEGGELEISFDPSVLGDPEQDGDYNNDLVVKPEFNTLAVMPAHYPHRVLPTKGKVDRLTVNGHISIMPT